MPNEGIVDEPVIQVTGHGGNPPGQGPFIDITLRVEGGVVQEATYESHLCPGTVACGKALCEMIASKTLEEARAFTYPILVERVGPLPKHRRISYALAIAALADALTQLDKTRKERGNQ